MWKKITIRNYIKVVSFVMLWYTIWIESSDCMIKNIVFDLGNVILKGKSSTCISNICENKEEQEILKAFFNSNTQELDLGYITIKDYYEQCNIQKNIKEKYKNKLIEYYKYRSYNEDILELINKLKENYNIIYYQTIIMKYMNT